MRPVRLLCAIAALHCASQAGAACLELDPLASHASRDALPQELLLASPEAQPSLVSGWGPPLPQPGEPRGIVWADDDRSILEVTLPRAATLAARLRLLVPPCGTCGPQTAAVSVNGTDVAELRFAGGRFEEAEFTIPGAILRSGVNALAFRWGWRRAPSELDPRSTLTRPVAAAVAALALAERTPAAGAVALRPGALDVPAGQALSFLLELPAAARLQGEVSRAAASRAGSAGLVRIEATADGAAPVLLATRTLAGLSRTGFRFDADLGHLAGEVVRLSFSVEGSEPGSGFVASLHGLSLCAGLPVAAGDLLGLWTPPEVPEAASGGARPSVLLYLMDALRARSLGCYGAPEVSSPHLDRLSRQGVLLSQQVSQASNTPPSVKALLTGRYLPRTGNAPLAPTEATLAERFAAAGYRTGVFTNSPWIGAVGAFRGFAEAPRDLYFGTVDYWLDHDGATKAEKRYAGAVTDRLASWASAAPGPLFAYAHTIHPHNPYEPPPPWGELDRRSQHWTFRGDTATLLEIQKGTRTPDRDEAAELQRLYHRDVLYNDHELGRLLRALDAAGLRRDAVLAFSSDHGDELLEHGSVLHGFTSYGELVDVPAILVAPGRLPAGRIVAGLTESVDLAPTLLALAGLPPLPRAEGRDLGPLIASGGAGRRRAYSSASSAPGIETAVAWPYKYVWAPRDGKLVGIGEGSARTRARALLFDLEEDPRELHDLRARRPILARFLHQGLASWLAATAGATTDVASPAAAPPLDDESRRLLESLGYLQP